MFGFDPDIAKSQTQTAGLGILHDRSTDRSLPRAEIARKDRTRTRRQNETPPDGDQDASKGTSE